ncbi:VapA/VapB family virulence-associated protein [Myceligenerans indicum]|uniref:VapA/VapB family virulence-associated protein n=1 Tax=Myceligenerans indicum TaxID=2593663 RepID=A0ABS1LR30_9MICO|nr:VapA/VapB family virulence-associated protein [Myceligenerans indicum]MBL0888741.1 VapA/VapB family virulence-associated protein [Myceligenerans indicum]
MVDETVRRTDSAVDRNRIAEEFATRMAGRLDQAKIDAAVRLIRATSTSYPADGSLASMIFYLKVWVNIKNGGKEFEGDCGGVGTPGGGALFGDVYTDDLNRLYAETETFELNAASVYTSIVFFDGDGNALGNFQSGSVSTVAGIFGGKGSWS